MVALAPVAQSNRVGAYLVAGGSSANAAYGKVSPNLVPIGGTWADALTYSQVTGPIADGVRAMHIRCPRGVWPGEDGNNWFNHCNANGSASRVPGPWHALNVAAGETYGVRLTQGYGTFLAGLNAQGVAITSYNNGLPNYKHPDGTGLTNWASDPLTQGNGYPTITNATDLAYIQALYQDELDNGCTEFAFDGCGGDRSTYMLSNVLFPLLTSTGTQTASGFSGTFTNSYARKCCVEANPPTNTGTWLTPYTFTGRHPTYGVRAADPTYVAPSAMAYTPAVIVQTTSFASWQVALAYAASTRVWVKWTAMKAAVGSDRMAELLAAGAAPIAEPPPTEPPASGSTGVTVSGGIRYGNARALPGRWRTGVRG